MAFQSDQGYSKVSSGQAPCQIVSQRQAATNMLMISQPAHQLVVRQAGQRLRLIRSFATKHPLGPSGLTCRPRLLPLPTSEQSVPETLQAMEDRWVAPCKPAPEAQLASASVAALPSIRFITSQQLIKHLGVLFGYDMQAASRRQFTGIYHATHLRLGAKTFCLPLTGIACHGLIT